MHRFTSNQFNNLVWLSLISFTESARMTEHARANERRQEQVSGCNGCSKIASNV